MPVIWKKAESNFSIIVWQSTEQLTELLENVELSSDEFAEWKSFRSESRKREYLTVRNALKILSFGKNLSRIIYDSNGKPHLEEDSISISHSHNTIAVMIANVKRIGIDIEIIHPRISTLSKKFLSEKEKEDLSGDSSLEKLHVIWGAKEVLYKIHSIGGIDFKKDLLVHPFECNNKNELNASILKTGFAEDFRITYEKIDKHMLTWACKRVEGPV